MYFSCSSAYYPSYDTCAQVQVLEQLGGSDSATAAPIWSSFCGTSNGAWQGVQTAFSPVSGILPCFFVLF